MNEPNLQQHFDRLVEANDVDHQQARARAIFKPKRAPFYINPHVKWVFALTAVIALFMCSVCSSFLARPVQQELKNSMNAARVILAPNKTAKAIVHLEIAQAAAKEAQSPGQSSEDVAAAVRVVREQMDAVEVLTVEEPAAISVEVTVAAQAVETELEEIAAMVPQIEQDVTAAQETTNRVIKAGASAKRVTPIVRTTATRTATRGITWTRTSQPTATLVSSMTPQATPTNTLLATGIPDTPNPTAIFTVTPSSTASDEPTLTPEPIQTETPSPIPTERPTNPPTDAPTATGEPTWTATTTATNTAYFSPTPAATNTLEPSPTLTVTETSSPTPSATASYTPSATDSPTSTPTDTGTFTPEPTLTPTPTSTPTFEPSATETDLPTETPYPTDTPTVTDEPPKELEITPEPQELPTDLIELETPEPLD
jgi:hypothetical protein